MKKVPYFQSFKGSIENKLESVGRHPGDSRKENGYSDSFHPGQIPTMISMISIVSRILTPCIFSVMIFAVALSCTNFPKATSIDHDLGDAIRANNFSRVTQLLEEGANPNALYYNNNTIFFETIDITVDISIYKALIEYGADVKRGSGSVLTPNSPLHRAASIGHEQLVTLLLENGVKVDAKDWEGKTPLQRAMDSVNCDQVCLLLIKAGAKSEVTDIDGRSVLDSSLYNFRPETARYLLNQQGTAYKEYAQQLTETGKHALAALTFACFGRYEEALDLTEKSLEFEGLSNDELADIYDVRRRIYERTGHRDKAAEAFVRLRYYRGL